MVEDSKEKEVEKVEMGEIDIIGPLTFWMGLLLLALVMELFLIPLSNDFGSTVLSGYLNKIANYIVYLPGNIILPLLTSVWVGERIGSSEKKLGSILNTGFVNAMYVSLVYVVAIFIIYLIVIYTGVKFLTDVTLNVFLQYLIALPVAIVIIVIPVFSEISAARRRT